MSESTIKDENYYQISGFMINRLGLKGVSLNVYAIIYGFTQDGASEFTGGLQYLCDFCGGVSKPTVIKALKELTEAGYIIRREEYVNTLCFPRYKVNLPLLKNFNGGSKETLMGVVKNFNGGSKETLTNNKDNNKILDNNIKIIIDYLNEKAGVHYRYNAANTMRCVGARLREGFTVDDCKTVIDKKCAEWCATDMAKYLRPETLFGSKFESYLNAQNAHNSAPQNNGSFDVDEFYNAALRKTFSDAIQER